MNLTLNDAQLRVLQWVADGADLDNPPTETFKTSAPALKARGLVTLDKRRGHWSIAITEAGRFYLEHGRHPDATTPEQKKSSPAKPRKPKPEELTPQPAEPPEAPQPVQPVRVVKDETIPMATRITKPHPAIGALLDHEARLDVPIEHRRRALIILHSFVQHGLSRGWTATAIPSRKTKDPWNGRTIKESPGPTLFTVDAGDAAVSVRITMQQDRKPHIPTAEELAEQARYSWNRPPQYDFFPSTRMRLELSEGREKYRLDDTVATRVEDKLLRGITWVEQRSAEARRIAERQRQWALEQAERQRRAEEMRQRATRYTAWFETLERLRSDYKRHQELSDTVAALRDVADRRSPDAEHAELLNSYVAWAEEHLAEADPLRAIELPRGERPDLSYNEWRDWKRQHPERW